MSDKFRISDLSGIELSIARLCNINGDDWIKGNKEVSLFNQTKATINTETNTFIFNNLTYNANGSIFIKNEAEIRKQFETSQIAKMNSIHNYKADFIHPEVIQTKKATDFDVQKLENYWNNKKIYPQYDLSPKFYEHLKDTCRKMNCLVSEKDFDPTKYNSREEQTVFEMSAIFAVESSMYHKKTNSNKFFGTWQVSSSAATTVNQEIAKDKENLPPTEQKKLLPKLTPQGMLRISPEKQLDYLEVYIKACKRRYSKIPQEETITPAQVWAMIKSPYAGNNDKKVEAKQNIINSKLKRLEKP